MPVFVNLNTLLSDFIPYVVSILSDVCKVKVAASIVLANQVAGGYWACYHNHIRTQDGAY